MREAVIMDTGVEPVGVGRPQEIKFGLRREEFEVTGTQGQERDEIKAKKCVSSLNARKSRHLLPTYWCRGWVGVLDVPGPKMYVQRCDWPFSVEKVETWRGWGDQL